MSNFDYNFGTKTAIKEYDNQGAYNTLQEMMKRKEQLIVKFYGSKDNTRCVLQGKSPYSNYQKRGVAESAKAAV